MIMLMSGPIAFLIFGENLVSDIDIPMSAPLRRCRGGKG